MSFVLNTLSFNIEQTQQFYEQLNIESESSHRLIDLLQAPCSSLEQQLTALDHDLIIHLSRTLSKQSKSVFLLMLFFRLNQWEPQSFVDEKKFSQKLFTLNHYFCGTDFIEAQLTVYLIYKFKSIRELLALLEKKFIGEFLHLKCE